MSHKVKEPTKKEAFDILVRCGKDPRYFLDNFAKVSHPKRGLIPMKLFPYQEELVNKFQNHRFNIVLKARQIGASAIAAAYISWLLYFHKEQNVLIISTKVQTATNLVRKTKMILKNLPSWFNLTKIVVDNKTSIELDNGSQIKAASSTVDAARSEALSLLVIDEAAFIEDMEDIWTAASPTISTGGRCITLSTPNGTFDWFHSTYTQAEQNLNDFFYSCLPWWVHPERDQKWFEKETRNMSKRQIAQEFLCEFLASGNTVIDPEYLKWIEERDIKEPITKMNQGIPGYWQWKSYELDKTYVIAADTARGDGEDFSAFEIFDVENMEQVAEFKGKLGIDDFSSLLIQVGYEYGGCMIVVENNNLGWTVAQKMVSEDYSNVYHSIKSTGEYVDQYDAQNVLNAVPGFPTSMKTRPLIIAKFEEYVRHKSIKIRSKRLLYEMKNFIWHNGRPEAAKGYNDDALISTCIVCWVRDSVLITNKQDLEYKMAILDAVQTRNTFLNIKLPEEKGYKKELDLARPKDTIDKDFLYQIMMG